jgi:tetratricopeptide (TPR) repeat protein
MKKIRPLYETEGRKRERLSQELMELCRNPKSDFDLIKKYEKEVNKIDNKMLNRNLKGKALEKEGKIDEAIKLYEKNIKEEFDGTFPYNRLAIIYTKKGLLDDEIRVLERAILFFENIISKNKSDNLSIVEKFKYRLEKANKRKSKFK